VAYLRTVASDKPAARITTLQHDAAGRRVAERDPRFFSAISRPNQITCYSLSGTALMTDSIDAGWRLTLADETGQVLEQWDGRGSHWQSEYDELRRPVALQESVLGTELRTIERLTYADNSPEFAKRNQCGSLIRQDDSAGTLWFNHVALNGGLIRQTRRFLPDQADLSANWPATEADRDLLLQPGEGYTTEYRFGPSGETLEFTDAGRHRQQFHFDHAGQLQRIDLTLKGEASKPLLKAADYNAAGQLLTQLAGNNVTSTASYQPENGRLERLTATTSTRQRLQDLSYQYDPCGNILRLVDHTQADSYFDNQRVAAENTYTYDSLYQLTSAKGRETARAGQSPGLPELHFPSPIDPGLLVTYSEYYEYDNGGNRTMLRHESDKNPFSRQMYVDPQSNRALPWNEDEGAPDFSRHFDANGNLQYLASGAQPMTWDARNQLQGITTVVRASGVNDGEWYRYNAAGERVAKFSNRQTHTLSSQEVVHYLPGLEMRTVDGREALQVLHVQLARGSVRCLYWLNEPPNNIDNCQLRYSVDDHLGSSCLELDQGAAIISHEGYYPYGGTAWWAARSKVDADYKTIRYSGKEQDASGLYYYGARYYAAWLGRWINPDPAENIDGLNQYRMVGNNPVSYVDPTGQKKEKINKDIHMIWIGEAPELLAAHIDNINNTVKQASGYKVHLYIETATKNNYASILNKLNVNSITYLRESKLFADFQKTDLATLYNDFRLGDPRNLAFTADTLKPFILSQLGGMYSDVDDVFVSKNENGQQRMGDTSLMAEPNELILHEPVNNPLGWLTASNVIPNSVIASHKHNPVLNDVMEEMVSRYSKLVATGTYSKNNGYIGQAILEKNPDDRTNIMSKLVGPSVWTDVVMRHDNEIKNIIVHSNEIKYGQKEGSQSFNELMESKMPLGRYINLGNSNSWK